MLVVYTGLEDQLLIRQNQIYTSLQKGYDSKENNMKIKYANNFVHKLGMGDTTPCVY